jgi:hypothetical protein
MFSLKDHGRMLQLKWSVTLKEGRNLRLSENKVFKETLGCKRNDIIL